MTTPGSEQVALLERILERRAPELRYTVHRWKLGKLAENEQVALTDVIGDELWECGVDTHAQVTSYGRQLEDLLSLTVR